MRGTSSELAQAARLLRHEQTSAEAALWQALRGRRLAGLKFRRQHAVGPFVLDFFCSELKLMVEVDGGIHDEPDQRSRDAERTELLNAVGYHVVHVRNEEVLERPETALGRIRATAEALRRERVAVRAAGAEA